MPKKTSAGKGAKAAPVSKKNPAKAAFEEYRRKMASLNASGGVNKDTKYVQGSGKSHAAPPMPSAAPQMFYGAYPGTPPQQTFFSNPQHPGFTPPFQQMGGPLFLNLGNMVRLMVDVVNAGLAGGLQLMGGLSHRERGCCEPHGHQDCCSCKSSSCCDCGCSSGYTECCCDPCYDSCCRPSVNNCSCC